MIESAIAVMDLMKCQVSSALIDALDPRIWAWITGLRA